MKGNKSERRLRKAAAACGSLRGENGEANLIAVILIIIVVIALVVIFRNQLIGIVNRLFEKINGSVDGF